MVDGRYPERRGYEALPPPPLELLSRFLEYLHLKKGLSNGQAPRENPLNISAPPTGSTYAGRCVGKQLLISHVDEKK